MPFLMVKSLIILVLALALAGGAALAKPSEANFKQWYKTHEPRKKENILDKIFGSRTDSFLSKCVYKDRIIWADIEKDGQVIYSGAFGKWISRGGRGVKREVVGPDVVPIRPEDVPALRRAGERAGPPAGRHPTDDG